MGIKKYQLIAIATAAILLTIYFMDGISGQGSPFAAHRFQTGVVGLLDKNGPPGAYAFPGDADVDPVGKTVESAPGSHTTRVAPWTPGQTSGPVPNPPVPNFGIVESGRIYRSAQPSETQLGWLEQHGFKSIVSFRRETGDPSQQLLRLGFKNALWLNVEDETAPTNEQAERFLGFVTDPQNWPTLIHCKVGVGRTGTMAALVRYAIDGLSMEEAIKEAKLYRGGIDLVPSQIEWLKNWAANHPPACHRPIAPPSPA